MSTGEAELKAISDPLQRSIAGHPLGSPVQAPDTSLAPSIPSTQAASTSSWLDEMERLAKLHATGALTDEEFTVAKRKLLGT